VSDGGVDDARNAALLEWYATDRRDLPWRHTTDPYRILVAEVMSQQTQIARVVPAYETFIARFPTVDHLAVAPLRDVMEMWSGLGYNNRAQRLHATAKQVSAQGWPGTLEGLLELPGVGPYTAHAVAAFAMGARVPAIDTNLKRVLSRWYGEELEGEALAQAANDALADDAASWNQAIMDLGASICTPRSPHCDLCPVAPFCAGPGVYTPPRPQPRFEGSVRQVRGGIVRELVHGPALLERLKEATGSDDGRLETALDGLIDNDIVVEQEDGSFRLAD
jgi:A/G-specific adenine glycosylase